MYSGKICLLDCPLSERSTMLSTPATNNLPIVMLINFQCHNWRSKLDKWRSCYYVALSKKVQHHGEYRYSLWPNQKHLENGECASIIELSIVKLSRTCTLFLESRIALINWEKP